MRQNELWNLIIESWDTWWTYIPDGPLFTYNLGNSNGHATVFGYHSARAVFIDDIDVALEWGMPEDPLEPNEGEFTAEWAPFRNPSIKLCFADVFYRGSLVERVSIASVDGNRVYLPTPEQQDDAWVVSDREFHLARVINDIAGKRDFETFFKRSGIVKWPA